MFFLYLINRVLDIFLLILIIRAVVSWIAPFSRNDFTNALYSITEPVLSKCKVVVPIGKAYIDLSYMVVYFGVSVVKRVINYLYYTL
ncbi:MAG: YggT family protein [Fusobacteriaceae bacterium]|nr:YggT family protein [Fusobacteriaceae bacterium]MBP9510748.1 YggT family protein [Fusobacteriaceae bacterium]